MLYHLIASGLVFLIAIVLFLVITGSLLSSKGTKGLGLYFWLFIIADLFFLWLSYYIGKGFWLYLLGEIEVAKSYFSITSWFFFPIVAVLVVIVIDANNKKKARKMAEIERIKNEKLEKEKKEREEEEYRKYREIINTIHLKPSEEKGICTLFVEGNYQFHHILLRIREITLSNSEGGAGNKKSVSQTLWQKQISDFSKEQENKLDFRDLADNEVSKEKEASYEMSLKWDSGGKDFYFRKRDGEIEVLQKPSF